MDETAAVAADCSWDDLLEIAGKYGIPHKHLVQLMLQEGILQVDVFCRKFVQFVELYGPEGNAGKNVAKPTAAEEKTLLEKLLATINNALAEIDLRLIQADDEYEDEITYIVLLSEQMHTEEFRDAFGLSLTDCALIHLWFGTLCSSESGEITKRDALAAASDLSAKGKNVDEEHVLQECISRKWFSMDDETTKIHLDTRGVAELQSFFALHAGEFNLQKCFLCGKYIVIKNRAVTCKTCGRVLHRQCARKLIQNTDLTIGKSGKPERAKCPGKIADGSPCTEELRVPEIPKIREDKEGASVLGRMNEQYRRGNRKRRSADDSESDDNGES